MPYAGSVPHMRACYSGYQKHEVCQILRGSAFRTEATIFTSRNLRKPLGNCDSQLPITHSQLPIPNYRTYLTFLRKAIYYSNTTGIDLILIPLPPDSI